jgi:hypothetical protein
MKSCFVAIMQWWSEYYGNCPLVTGVPVQGALSASIFESTREITCAQCGKEHTLKGDEKCELTCECGNWIEQI